MGRPIRAQKDDDVRDLLRLAPAPLRNARQHRRFGTGSGRLYPIGQGVWTSPGATAFTRIPWVANCSAADFVRPDTPCLLATLLTVPAAPTRPTTETLLTIAPFPRFSISGISYFMQSQTPVRLIAMTRCQSSSLVSTIPAFDPTKPALLNA